MQRIHRHVALNSQAQLTFKNKQLLDFQLVGYSTLLQIQPPTLQRRWRHLQTSQNKRQVGFARQTQDCFPSLGILDATRCLLPNLGVDHAHALWRVWGWGVPFNPPPFNSWCTSPGSPESVLFPLGHQTLIMIISLKQGLPAYHSNSSNEVSCKHFPRHF